MSLFRMVAVSAMVAGMAAPAFAAPHPAYQGLAVDGIATYKGTKKVGQTVFTMAFVESSLKKAPGNALKKLTFAQGQPPAEWWGRSYYAATLAEVVKSIRYENRGHKLVTHVYLGKELVENSAAELDKDMLGPTWNTTAWDAAEVKAALSELAPGKHKLVVWRQLDYQVKTHYKETGKTVWEPASITLAKGTLEIEVTE